MYSLLALCATAKSQRSFRWRTRGFAICEKAYIQQENNIIIIIITMSYRLPRAAASDRTIAIIVYIDRWGSSGTRRWPKTHSCFLRHVVAIASVVPAKEHTHTRDARDMLRDTLFAIDHPPRRRQQKNAHPGHGEFFRKHKYAIDRRRVFWLHINDCACLMHPDRGFCFAQLARLAVCSNKVIYIVRAYTTLVWCCIIISCSVARVCFWMAQRGRLSDRVVRARDHRAIGAWIYRGLGTKVNNKKIIRSRSVF